MERKSISASSNAPWRVYNIGNNRTVEVSRVVDLLEQEFGRPALREMAPMQPGDVAETRADVDDLMRDVGFRPSTSIEEGIKRFAAWYRAYRRIRLGRTDGLPDRKNPEFPS